MSESAGLSPESDTFWILLKLFASVTGIIFFGGIRSFRKGKLIDTKDLLGVSVAVTGVVLALSLFSRSVTSSKVIEVLKEDIIALCIGALAQGLASIDSDFKEDFLYLWSKIRLKKSKSSGSSQKPPPKPPISGGSP
jgi:hypothetical protein